MIEKKLKFEINARICGDPSGEGLMFCSKMCEHLDRISGFCNIFGRSLYEDDLPDPFVLWRRAPECLILEKLHEQRTVVDQQNNVERV